jgi:hypothetical protein
MSPMIPASCTRCGHVWQPTGGIDVENSTGVTFSNVTTDCPACGGVARFIEGTFDVHHGAIAMKAGPQWSFDLVNQVGLALKVAIDGNLDPVPLVSKVDPVVGAELERSITGMPLDRVLALVGLLYSALATDYIQFGDNVTALRDALVTMIRFIAEHGGLPN